MSTMALMDMRRSDGPRAEHLPRTPSFPRHPCGRSGTAKITCSECGFNTHSELDFLHHVSTHKIVVENPKNYERREPRFPSSSKRRRTSPDLPSPTEKPFQCSLVERMTMPQHSTHQEAADTEQADSNPLDLTKKPRGNSVQAPVDLRKATPPPYQPLPQTGQTRIAPERRHTVDNVTPARVANIPTLAARKRYGSVPVMPRRPPPLIQFRKRPSMSDGKVQVEPRNTVSHDITPVAVTHPVIHQHMNNGNAFPPRQSETMNSSIQRQPHPSTLFAPPITQFVHPTTAGTMAPSYPTNLPTYASAINAMQSKYCKPSKEMSTVFSQQPAAPQDISETKGTRYHRLGKVPEYLRGGTWHPNQPTAVNYTIPEERPEQASSQSQSLEWARMSAVSNTVQQQRRKRKPGPKPGKKPSTRDLGPSPEATRQPDAEKQHVQLCDLRDQQDKAQEARNQHQLELEERQNRDKQIAQEQEQRKETHDQQPEQNQQSPINAEEEIKELEKAQDADQKYDQQQAQVEATESQLLGDKLWWQQMQKLMNMLGEKQKQDTNFAEKWFNTLFPMHNKSVICQSAPPVEKEETCEPTIAQGQESVNDCGQRSKRRSTTDSDYVSMDEESGQTASSSGHQSDNKEEISSSPVLVIDDDIDKKDQSSQNVSMSQEKSEKSPEDEKDRDKDGLTSPESDKQEKVQDSSPPEDTTVSLENNDTTKKEASPQGYSPQPLNVHFFRCSPCNFFTTSRQKKLAHLREHKEKFECTICLKGCKNKDGLEEHMQEHTGQGLRQHKCPYTSCGYHTASSVRLQKHKRAVHKTRDFYQCPFCKYKSTVQGNMNRHLRKHTDERPYKCPHCPYAARVSHHLQEHMQRHAGERPFKCTLCSFATLKKTDLDRHLRCHTGEKPFACDQCNYRAPQKRMLARHVLKVHQKQRPYHCQQCDYGAFEKKDLVEHIRQHSGEKPWRCSQCGYTTTRKRNLLRHVRVHTGEKPFKCPECSYAAADRRNLTDHLRTHTDERPFQCTICGYGSKTKGQLSRHLKTHHEVKSYKCPYCPFMAEEQTQVQQHLKSHPHQLSTVYSNLFHLLDPDDKMAQKPDDIATGASDGVPSPMGSNESVSSPSGSPRACEVVESFSSGAGDKFSSSLGSKENVPSLSN